MSQLELWCTARPNSEQPPRKQYPSHSHCLIVDMSHDTWLLTVHDFHYFRFSNVGAFELICTGHTQITQPQDGDQSPLSPLSHCHPAAATTDNNVQIRPVYSVQTSIADKQVDKWTYHCIALPLCTKPEQNRYQEFPKNVK